MLLCEENEVYTNDLGQIKVKFNWDRYTEDSEHTSCWLRVSQQLADENWGFQFLPRVGSEVIVDTHAQARGTYHSSSCA